MSRRSRTAAALSSPELCGCPDCVAARTRPRRRRSAVLGGGVLVAAAPVAVAAGVLVPGFVALAVGGLLLLLPPRLRAPHQPRWERVGGALRVSAAWIGRASVRGSEAGAHAVALAGSRSWSATRLRAPKIWRRLVRGVERGWVLVVIAVAWLVRAGGRGARVLWAQMRPALAGASRATLVAGRRGVYGLRALGQSASRRGAAAVDAAARSETLRSLRPGAPRPRGPGFSARGRRARELRPDSRTRRDRSRRSPPSSQ
jgi:hypothetical protein